MKRLFALLLTLILLLSMLPASFAAENDIISKGSSGKNVTWTLSKSGVLTFSGSGPMKDYGSCDYPFCDIKMNVSEVVIEEGITRIGSWTLRQCSMKKITIPSTVTQIGEGNFYHCNGLTSFVWPENVPVMEGNMFVWCENLKSVTLPSTLTKISYYAFVNCSKLQDIRIPASVSYIGIAAFGRCDKLTAIQIDEENPYYISEDGVLLRRDKSTLVQYPSGKKDKSYQVPDGVYSIASQAFYGHPHIQKVLLPESLYAISGEAFSSCFHLEEINLPSALQKIGDEAFYYCTNLKELHIPASVTSLGDNFVHGCKAMKSIDVDPQNANYMSQDGVLFNKAGDTLLKFPCGKSTAYKIPETIQTIAPAAFSLAKFKAITIPGSVTLIGKGAFSNTPLEEITLPGSIRKIEESAFAGCESLKRVRYAGTEKDRKKIKIGASNDPLIKASWSYNSSEDEVPVSSIKLNKSKATLKAGKTLKLKVKKILPKNATNTKVIWSSSDTSVATVSKNGKVTAIKEGVCIITCESTDSSGVKAECVINVK